MKESGTVTFKCIGRHHGVMSEMFIPDAADGKVGAIDHTKVVAPSVQMMVHLVHLDSCLTRGHRDRRSLDGPDYGVITDL